MKQKLYKAPADLREKVDSKISAIETMIYFGELFMMCAPGSLLKGLSIDKKKKK